MDARRGTVGAHDLVRWRVYPHRQPGREQRRHHVRDRSTIAHEHSGRRQRRARILVRLQSYVPHEGSERRPDGTRLPGPDGRGVQHELPASHRQGQRVGRVVGRGRQVHDAAGGFAVGHRRETGRDLPELPRVPSERHVRHELGVILPKPTQHRRRVRAAALVSGAQAVIVGAHARAGLLVDRGRRVATGGAV